MPLNTRLLMPLRACNVKETASQEATCTMYLPLFSLAADISNGLSDLIAWQISRLFSVHKAFEKTIRSLEFQLQWAPFCQDSKKSPCQLKDECLLPRVRQLVEGEKKRTHGFTVAGNGDQPLNT